jgi:hypothetical protein
MPFGNSDEAPRRLREASRVTGISTPAARGAVEPGPFCVTARPTILGHCFGVAILTSSLRPSDWASGNV